MRVHTPSSFTAAQLYVIRRNKATTALMRKREYEKGIICNAALRVHGGSVDAIRICICRLSYRRGVYRHF